MDKPSLHEIAAMPYPASLQAMRKHYVHDWGKPVPEGVTAKQKFDVEVEYEVTERHRKTVEVEAWNEDEASEEACLKVENWHRLADDVEIENVTVKPSRPTQ